MTRAAAKVIPQSSSAGAARGSSAAPPEWAIEKLVKTVGKIPAAAGRLLDGLAKAPVLGAVVRLFSSVWLGITILVLIGAYIAIGSGFSDLRAYFEMTDLQFFDAWPMRVLLVCLVLDLSIVTLRRIPMTLFKLGPWTVHIGIITLISGSAWYFSQKQEGSVRVYLNQSVSHWYDATERALFAFPVNADGSFDTAHPTITPIPNLPIYYEHRPESGNPVDISLAKALPGSDAVVHVYGYYPSAILQPAGARAGTPGEKGVGPAIAIKLATSRDEFPEHWLLANSPSQRVLEFNFPFGFEYLRQPDPQRVKDLEAPFDGPYALTVRLPKLNIERTYAIKPNEAIAVEGSPYTITPRDLATMPMASKGYKGASSTTMTVDVSRKDGDKTFNFQRMCVGRYPELSPDFVMEDGKMTRKQAGVDSDIQLVFHDISRTENWIIEAADGKLTLITRTPDGKCVTQPLTDKAVAVDVPDMPAGPLQVRVSDRTDNAVVIMKPDIIPPEQRPRGQQVMELLQLSMIDLEVTSGNWKQEDVHVPFSPYAEIGERPVGDEPSIVNLPDGKKVGLLLATTPRPLPSTLTLTQFEPIKYPGAVNTYADYRSTFRAVDGSGTPRELSAHLNNPAADHGFFYFQQAWDGDDHAPPEKRFSVIGVGNRPGIHVMVIGAILIALGIGYAFYAKPLLLKFKKESLAKWALAQRGKAGPGASQTR